MTDVFDLSDLDGQFLIASPTMSDRRFLRAVIYICAHSAEGSMGIVVNQPHGKVSFTDLLAHLGMIQSGDAIRIDSSPVGQLKIQRGGPVDEGRGFVLHSNDYFIDDCTLSIDDTVCLTATMEILRAISQDRGPRKAMLALGYAGWGPGQLQDEILANGWIVGPADPAIIFDPDIEDKWSAAIHRLGVRPDQVSDNFGYC